MNIIILKSVLDTLENIELRGKDNHVRMVACMNALEQLIQDAANPMPEQPVTPTQQEEEPECQEDIAGKENTVYGEQTD